MSKKEDLRVRRTKKALFTAFVELVRKKTIDELTVNELCEIADVRRATFYKHYTDKYDFLTAFTCHLRDNFDQSMRDNGAPDLTTDYYVTYAKRIVAFLCENAEAVDNIYKSNIFPTVLYTIVDQNYKDTCERLNASVAAGMKLTASVEVVASMCAGGVGATIYRWLADGKQKNPDELAEEIGAVVAAAIGQN